METTCVALSLCTLVVASFKTLLTSLVLAVVDGDLPRWTGPDATTSPVRGTLWSRRGPPRPFPSPTATHNDALFTSIMHGTSHSVGYDLLNVYMYNIVCAPSC